MRDEKSLNVRHEARVPPLTLVQMPDVGQRACARSGCLCSSKRKLSERTRARWPASENWSATLRNRARVYASGLTGIAIRENRQGNRKNELVASSPFNLKQGLVVR